MSQDFKPYFIGISGGSASGKTFLLNRLLNRYGSDEITLISQDNYYLPHEIQVRDSNGDINFDHPDAVNLEALYHDLKKLSRGENVQLREYTFGNTSVTPKVIVYNPSRIMLVEGLFVFYKEEISSMLDLKLFVDADEHIKLSRRIRRDFEERGYGLDEVLRRYEGHVIPMYKKFVAPYKEICDLIIPNNFRMEKAVEVVCDHIDRIIQK